MYIKKVLKLLFPLLCVGLFATADEKNEEISSESLSMKTDFGVVGPSLASSRIPESDTTFSVIADAICWQSKVEGIEYIAVVKTTENAPIAFDQVILEPKFNYSFGFRVGLDYGFTHDRWDILVEYTYFRNRANNSKNTTLPSTLTLADAGYLNLTASSRYQASLGNTAYYAADGSSWIKASLDDVILSLGKGFYVSKYLSLKPNFGIKSSWITLKQNQHFTGGGIAFSVNSASYPGLGNNFLVIKKRDKLFTLGPEFGIDSKWILNRFFSLYADISEAFLFAYTNRVSSAFYSGYPDNGNHVAFKFHRFITATHVQLGVSFDKRLFNDKQNLSIALGYEGICYINAIYLRTNLTPGNYGMQGVTFRMSWNM